MLLSPSNRLVVIDLARGFALLGVALVNVHAFAAAWSSVYGLDLAASATDVVAEYTVAMLFTHRSYPVLAFLFGVGLAWQWQRLPDTGRAANRLRPRLWALLLIGLSHGLLLWPGDVLTTYAVMGLVIVAMVNAGDRAMLRTTMAVYALTACFYLGLGALGLHWAAAASAVNEPASSFAQTTWRAALALHRGEYLERGLVQLLVPDFWAHALLGLWAGRSGALRQFLDAAYAPQRQRINRIGALLFFAGTTVEIIAAHYGGWNVRSFDDFGVALMTLAVLPASVGGLWLWLTVARAWSQRGDCLLRSWVVAAGRAPLSQFVGQSIVFSLLFNKSLVGLHGELGRAAYSLIALATYVLLCAFIRAWLASGHAHGPMEILWRQLTKLLSPQPSSGSIT